MKKTIEILKNKYVLTSISLLVWVLFFDKNDFRTLQKLRHQVSQLEEEKVYYINEINKINFQLKELTTNMQSLETFAREKYLMKRDDEDIFVIVRQ